MFATIRKHQKWLWGLIIAATIISFVIFFTPSAGRGDRGGGRASFGTLNGRPITRKQYSEAYNETKLEFFMRYGSWPDQAGSRRAGFNVERETRNRLVLLDQIKQLGVNVSESAVAQWIIDNFGMADRPGLAKERYENFVRGLEHEYKVSEADFQRFVERQVGIGHLAAVAGVAGKLVTPRVAADLYRQEQEKIEAEAVVFSASNHLGAVKMDPAAVAQFYTNQESVYRIPERVQVNYVKFSLTNYLALADEVLTKSTNLSYEIERAYLANPSSFTDTNGQVLPPDAAKAKLRERVHQQQALAEAHKAAAKFATALALETNQPVSGDTLIKLAAKQGLPNAVTEPFSERYGPESLRVRPNFTEVAFRLKPQEPIALAPIRQEDGVYVISLKQRYPSEIPSLDAIRPRVEQEYRQFQAVLLAREAGTNFLKQLTNGLAHGQNFATACAEAKVTPIALPKFALASRTVPDWDQRIDLNQAKAVAVNLAPDKASTLVGTQDGGFVLHLKARVPVPESELNQELPQFMVSLRQGEQVDAFNEWFRHQLEASHIDTLKGREEAE